VSTEPTSIITEALEAAARAAVPEGTPVPQWQPPGDDKTRVHGTRLRRLTPLVAAAAVLVLAAAGSATVAVLRSNRPSPGVGTTPTSAPISASPLSQPPIGSSPTNPSSTTPPISPTPFELGYQPMWPFADRVAAAAWESSYAADGLQPWDLDAGQTALTFTSGYLGFTELDQVTSSRIDDDGAHVGVGYRDPNGEVRTAAVVHLVRFGPAATAPWEVVGTDDTTFSLEQPAYGSTIRSPVTVGGHITGVDESIQVTVRRLSSSTAAGSACCTPAGGQNQPWSTSISFQLAAPGVITVVASTGGHLQRVERFAIQGFRTP
jgi:hypothetical protein